MHNGIRLICEKLIADPESCMEGAKTTEWTHAARLVMENSHKLFTDEEVEAVKDAWKESQRMNFFGIIVELVHNKKAFSKLPLTRSQQEVKMDNERQEELYKALEYAKRRDPQLGRELERMKWEQEIKGQRPQDRFMFDPYTHL